MKNARNLSIAILFLLCISSLYGSYYMITDPTGNSLGLPFYLLNGTMLTSYLMAGWVLLVVVGIFSLITMFSIFRKTNIYSILIMLQGIIICIFIVLQMVLLGETFAIQYVYLISGAALIGLGFLQNQRKIVVDTERKLKPEARSHHHKHRKRK